MKIFGRSIREILWANWQQAKCAPLVIVFVVVLYGGAVVRTGLEMGWLTGPFWIACGIGALVVFVIMPIVLFIINPVIFETHLKKVANKLT